MSATKIFGDSSLDSVLNPNWYFVCMHISTAMTIPTNIFGFLMIIFCEKQHMNAFRWHLMFYQVFSMLSDILINSGIVPIVFSPFPIGIPNGFLNTFFEFFGLESSTWIQCEVMFCFLFMAGLGVEVLFLYRYQVILPTSHRHRLSSFSYFLMLFLYQFFWLTVQFVAFWYTVSNQSTAKFHFTQMYPEFAQLVESERSMVVAVHINPSIVLFLVICFTRLGTGLFICGWLVFMSKKALDDLILSPRTKIMHSRLINTLCCQVSIPVISFYLPLIIVIIPIIFSLSNTSDSFLVCAVFFSYHTFLGTLSILVFNKPYRTWLIRCVTKKNRLVSMTTQSEEVQAKKWETNGMNRLTSLF